jgi:hypothetical protein
MTPILRTLAVAGVLVAAATAAGATSPAIGSKGETVGEMLAHGQISAQAVQQLIMHTGMTFDQAKSATLDEIIAERWQNS